MSDTVETSEHAAACPNSEAAYDLDGLQEAAAFDCTVFTTVGLPRTALYAMCCDIRSLRMQVAAAVVNCNRMTDQRDSFIEAAQRLAEERDSYKRQLADMTADRDAKEVEIARWREGYYDC